MNGVITNSKDILIKKQFCNFWHIIFIKTYIICSDITRLCIFYSDTKKIRETLDIVNEGCFIPYYHIYLQVPNLCTSLLLQSLSEYHFIYEYDIQDPDQALKESYHEVI